MHDGLKPSKTKLTGPELVALYHNQRAHPKALGHELMVTTDEALLWLVRRVADDQLAMMASAERMRRAEAIKSLLRASPALSAALAARSH